MKLRLPELARDPAPAIITRWHYAEGDNVTSGDDIVEVTTDKATFDVSAPCTGVLIRIDRRAGEEVRTEDVIGEIREDRVTSETDL